ncbi:MAG TPA: BLUF domain-containing protein [Brevundimonas sp.]|jgi:hypothetical protein|uniref:BLUF domain-containing protein n=1 Tax=Brevundimonas sp. TaxID=1871086 RepID=UPI002DEA6597|nr:BLUF domain-containing protein [Brevundimonas sp.]
MLRRVVYTSRSIGGAGLSTVSLAHILGAGERNNRRDQITSGLVVHGDRILQALEGPANEVGRTLARVQADPRHTDVEILVDTTTTRRVTGEAIALCDDPEAFLRAVSLPCLSLMTAEVAEAFVERRLAA